MQVVDPIAPIGTPKLTQNLSTASEFLGAFAGLHSKLWNLVKNRPLIVNLVMKKNNNMKDEETERLK